MQRTAATESYEACDVGTNATATMSRGSFYRSSDLVTAAGTPQAIITNACSNAFSLRLAPCPNHADSSR